MPAAKVISVLASTRDLARFAILHADPVEQDERQGTCADDDPEGESLQQGACAHALADFDFRRGPCSGGSCLRCVRAGRRCVRRVEAHISAMEPVLLALSQGGVGRQQILAFGQAPNGESNHMNHAQA